MSFAEASVNTKSAAVVKPSAPPFAKESCRIVPFGDCIASAILAAEAAWTFTSTLLIVYSPNPVPIIPVSPELAVLVAAAAAEA